MGYSYASNPCRLIEHKSVNDFDLWWDDGVSFDNPPIGPITAKLRPYQEAHPDMSPDLPVMYDVSVLILRDDLVAALKEVGVNNFDEYPCEITDPDNGKVYNNYKAINFTTMVRAVDMKASEAIVHDNDPRIDVNFDKLVLDENALPNELMFRLEENNGALLMHKKVKDYLVEQGFTTLEFYELDKIAF